MNITSIVSQLVAAEGQPVNSQIASQTAAFNTKFSGLGQLQSALSTFQAAVTNLQTNNSFQTNAATSSNTSVLTVTPGSGAPASTHTVVVNQLATQQNSITSAEFTNTATVVGTGTLNFSIGSGTSASTFSVNVDSSNDTLAGVVNAINSAKGNTSVQASIINVNSATSGGGTVAKLVLTATNPGTANAFTVTGTDANPNDTGNQGLMQLYSVNSDPVNSTAAKDSIISVDGLTATNSSNTLSNVLPGVTLNLQSVSSTAVQVGVSLDTATITSSLNTFISAYNALNSTIQGLQAYGGVGGTNGALFGDPALQFAEDQIRSITTAVVPSVTSGYNSLAMLGVTVDNTGTMALNSTQLSSALSVNPQAVNQVFNNKDGISYNLVTSLTNINSSGGAIATEATSISSGLSALKSQQTAENTYLNSYQATLQHEFSSMQSLVSQYSSTGTFLTSWINSTNGTSSSSSSSKG
jgi:flagellar hook-associated protein 2